MNKTDFLTVVERINGLAELYGQKPPTQKAIEFWWEAIKGYMQGDVLGALDDWMRSKPKMPMPSDIVALTASKLSDRIESQAAADKAQEKREIAQMGATKGGRRVLEMLRDFLSEKQNRPRGWNSLQVVECYEAGTPLYFAHPITKERVYYGEKVRSANYAWHLDALKKLGIDPRARARLPEREPGQDDEEITV